MNEVKTFEEFDKKIKQLEIDKVRAETEYQRAKDETNKALELLLEITGKENLQDAVVHMKELKTKLNETKLKLDEEIKKFNEQLKELGD